MKNQNKKKSQVVTEEDLENFSGAFATAGPGAGSPWARIMQNTSEDWKTEWGQNLQKKYVPNVSEADLEELSGAFEAAGPNYGGSPWSVIVSNAPRDWKKKWAKKLKDKYPDTSTNVTTKNTVTEDDLENLSGAFQAAGPGAGSPWARIMQGTSDLWKAEWRENMQNKYIPMLNEEDLEELSGAFKAVGPDYSGSPWSTIVCNAPADWKKKWKKALKSKYNR